MTVKLIRDTAKEMASAFYEQAYRTEYFRRAYPTVKDFLRGRAHRRDGSILIQDPNWFQFVREAKSKLVDMLNNPNIHQHLKDAIEEALQKDFERGTKANAHNVMQINLDKREDQKRAYQTPAIRG